MKITSVDTHDVRFPTSRDLDGSDAMFDYVSVSGSLQDRVIEYVDHLHEHFVDPVVVSGGAYRVPAAPGFSSRLKPESLVQYSYPDGSKWV